VEIDAIIPSIRPAALQKAMYSLSKGSLLPNLVTVVSNELNACLPNYGMNVRVIQFRSGIYPIGSHDVALRRNIGIWSSRCSHIITFDDDQVAPVNLIETAVGLFRQKSYFWGHHRYIDFDLHSVDELLHMDPAHGRPREHPPNSCHSWLSCYAGLFGAERDVLLQLGGFDMAFCGRHAGEDQELGRRLARRLDHSDRVFIHEPPFAWHPTTKLPWSSTGYTNLCGNVHNLFLTQYNEMDVEACRACPYFRVLHLDFYHHDVLMRYDHSKVNITISPMGLRR